VLSDKAGSGRLIVLDKLEMGAPKTKEMAGMLAALGVDGSAIIAIPRMDENIVKSARNLPEVKTMLAPLLNVADLLSYKYLIMPVDAVRVVEGLWGVEKKTKAIAGTA
jgi:large subunit ribosomal protein L4